MRKFKAYGAAALLAVSAIAGGVSYAQDTSTTPAPTSTQAVTAPTAAQRTWLGVTVSDDGTGVTITRVAAGSPAETAQLQVGDAILAVNGTTVETASDLRAIIDAAASGDVVTLTVERASAQISVDVTLGSRALGGPTFSDPLQMAERALGAQLESAADGYQVVSVDSNSPFTLQAGDVITEVNGTAIASLDWRTLFSPSSTSSSVTLTVTRSGADVTVTGQLAAFGGRGGFPGGRPNGGQNNPPPGGNNGQPWNNGQPNGNNGQPGGAPPAGGNGQPGGAI